MANYSLNDVMDILTLGEYNRKIQTCFPLLIELYFNHRRPSTQQVINIERRVRRNTLHQRHINRLPNNNNLRLLSFGHSPFQSIYSANKMWIRIPSIYGSSNVTIRTIFTILTIPHQSYYPTDTGIEWEWFQIGSIL